MISRLVYSRNLRRRLQNFSYNPSRSLAAAASGSFAYESGDASGVKFASRDLPGPTTTLAVVARAGTRYQPLPGLTEGLERFAFKATERRSALRISREAELLGGELTARHSRENLVIGARFLKADLPYFVELLGEVISKTKYTRHEYLEEVVPTIQIAHEALLANPEELAINSAYALAFHRGLGNPLRPTSSTALSKYMDCSLIGRFSEFAYAKPNIAVVANGADSIEFAKWMGEFFVDTNSSSPEELVEIGTQQTKYHGGEERIAHALGNTMIIAFPGSSSFTGGYWKPEIAVLAALLGGPSSIKWSPGFSLLSKAVADIPSVHVSTTSATYSDAGLLCVTLNGNASAIARASLKVVEVLKKVATGEILTEDFKRAVATAKFRALDAGQESRAGIELTGNSLINQGRPYQIDEVGKSIEGVTESQLKSVAKTLLEGRATVSTIGDLFALPYAEEMGLNV